MSENTQWIKLFHLSYWRLKSVQLEKSYVRKTVLNFQNFLDTNVYLGQKGKIVYLEVERA